MEIRRVMVVWTVFLIARVLLTLGTATRRTTDQILYLRYRFRTIRMVTVFVRRLIVLFRTETDVMEKKDLK